MKEKKKTGGGRSDPVSRVGEFGLIGRILERFPIKKRGAVLVGPGDDAAVLAVGKGPPLVVTTDMLVEGTHFRLEWSCPESVGFKAVTANLSDIAAMGGVPIGIVVSIGIPPSLPIQAVDMLYLGISNALSRFGGELLGGDTVRAERITVSVAALGSLVRRRPLVRSGALNGDKICVTGSLGCSELGLLLLKRYFGAWRGSRKSALLEWTERGIGDFEIGIPAEIRKDGSACLLKHLMPAPRMREAQLLARQGACVPSSLIDVSDGLSSDLNQVARASKVGFEVLESKIPVHPSAAGVADHLGVSALRAAISSGEEYELLFTVPPLRLEDLSRAMVKAFAAPLTVIGEVAGAAGTTCMVSSGGRRSRLSHLGFKHF